MKYLEEKNNLLLIKFLFQSSKNNLLDVVGVHWDDVRVGGEVFKDFD